MFNVLLFGINKKIVDKLLERPNARNFNNMEYINLFSVVHVSSYLQLLFTQKRLLIFLIFTYHFI